MDIFRLLTRGASVKKNGKEVDFAHKQNKQNKQSGSRNVDNTAQITKELDFFRNKKILRNVESKSAAEDQNMSENEVDEDHLEDDMVPNLKIKTLEDATKLRNSYKAKVSGSDIPLPIGSFEDLITRFKLDKRLLNNLIENNFTEPTPIQCEAIPICLGQRDIVACAPTGTGKTLAFLVPLLQQIIMEGESSSGVRGLIISPTKELANQIFTECSNLSRKIFLAKKRPLNIALLSKSLSSKLRNKVVNENKYDIIISTPLRLIEVVKQESLDLRHVKHLIFDEADKLFDKTFLEQTDDILSSCSNANLTKAMFSATIPSTVEDIAQTIMLDPIRVIIGHKEAANSNIEQKIVFCGNEEGKLVAIRQLLQEGEFRPPVIIFLESITRAKALFHELVYDKLNVDVIHAERTQMQRNKIIERFKSGELWCLICTDVLARGVDFKAVNLVINYDVPRSAQAYVHRIGRTGRAGRSGKAITFFTKQDVVAIKPIVNVMKQSNCEVAEWMDKASKITSKEKEMLKKGHAFKDRKQISTVPKIVKQKRQQRKEMITASKKRKLAQEAGTTQTSDD
ncbi:HHL180Wp [Eremothecium sinecaudum]|uniref:ATP-dependent RNA helicase ROK1 n=1 Tax=Eremothecium sinecaudum TaxID=45286 RepID=A0A120K2U3_9SACH|nr:HHL180Wp [Eremothecium sinecaudum]AMD22590.1 HHL180Wp [Eremothecium sinecaudum]